MRIEHWASILLSISLLMSLITPLFISIATTADGVYSDNIQNAGPNVDVKLMPSYQEALPGENLNYIIVITNIGTVLDNFTATVEDTEGWGLAPGGFTVPLNPTENDTRTLTVTMPDHVSVDTEDNITVTATSQTDNTVSASNSCIAQAVPIWTGTAAFKLENLNMVVLVNDLQLNTGSKLVVKFYKYDNTFQAESVIDNFAPPSTILENENVPHPRGPEGFPWGTVQIARLVLTTDNTENVISIIASFTVQQSGLRTRDIAILRAWAGQPGLQSAFRAEVVDILRQWSGAPGILIVDGFVQHPLNLTFDELVAMPRTTVNANLYCVGLPNRLLENGNWTGVSLAFLLGNAGVSPDAIKVAFYAEDGYTTDLTITQAEQENVILAYEKDGAPLPEKLRLVVPGKWGYKWISQVDRIELDNYDFKGLNESRGYSDNADIS